jgi:hypothetical protein
MDPDNKATRNKVFAAIGIGLFIVLIIISLYITRGVKITIKALPSDSLITVDGKEADGDTVSLKPGIHTLKASRQYFADTTKIINTKDINPADTIYLLPKPNSPEAKKWLVDHPDVQRQIEVLGGKETDDIQNKLTNRTDLVNQVCS